MKCVLLVKIILDDVNARFNETYLVKTRVLLSMICVYQSIRQGHIQ